MSPHEQRLGQYEVLIERAHQQLLNADSEPQRRLLWTHLLGLIRARNAERSPQEIAQLERAKGLR